MCFTGTGAKGDVGDPGTKGDIGPTGKHNCVCVFAMHDKDYFVVILGSLQQSLIYAVRCRLY